MPFLLLQSRGFHPWVAIGTQPEDGMASMAKYQPVLDAREIKHFLNARAKGITIKLCGANGAQRSLRPNERIVMRICHYPFRWLVL